MYQEEIPQSDHLIQMEASCPVEGGCPSSRARIVEVTVGKRKRTRRRTAGLLLIGGHSLRSSAVDSVKVHHDDGASLPGKGAAPVGALKETLLMGDTLVLDNVRQTGDQLTTTGALIRLRMLLTVVRFQLVSGRK